MKIPPGQIGQQSDKNTHFQGVHKASHGYRLLSGMGWKEGEGLGVQKQGMVSHVKVTKKSDNSGVGVTQAARTARDWTVGITAYDKILAALKPVTETAETEQKQKASKKRKAAKIEVTESPEKDVAPAQKRKKGDKKRSKGKKIEITPQVAESSDSEEEAEKILEVQVRKVTHAGRFQKRVKNKLVHGYSQNDLSAILGERTQEQAGRSDQPAAQNVPQPAPAKKRVVIEIQPAPLPANEAQEEASEGSDVAETGPMWWHGYFQQAGGAGASDAYTAYKTAQHDVNINGFSEQDQANLWQNATDAQTKGRKGLGKGSGPSGPLNFGENWQGTRTVIEDESEQQPDAEPSAKADANNARSSPAGKEDTVGGPLKRCKKIARQILANEEQGRMRLKEFRVRMVDELTLRFGTISSEDIQQAIAKLGKSKQFAVEKKLIMLRR